MNSHRADDSGALVPRLASLDGLRTIAIAIVVLHHLSVPLFPGGFLGVEIFLVLSGYLITTILLREHAATGGIVLWRFWLRRALRLYPALIAVVLVAVLLWDAIRRPSEIGAAHAAVIALTYATNITNWIWQTDLGVLAPTWSLGLEEQFYLIWPPILMLLLLFDARRRTLVACLCALLVVATAAGWFLYVRPEGSNTPASYYSPVVAVGPLLMGVVLAHVLSTRRGVSLFSSRFGAIASWVGIIAIAAAVVITPPDWKQHRFVLGAIVPASAAAAFLLIGGIVSRVTVVSRALSWRPVAWFGRSLSYSLYLWHLLVFRLFEPHMDTIAGRLAAVVTACVVAAASFYLVERPFLRLKDRLEPALRSAQPVRVP